MTETDFTGPSAGLSSVGRAFRRECRGRKVHPTTVRVGTPGGPHIGVPDAPFLDGALRADLLERVLHGLDPATAVPWITRGGALSPSDGDFAWFAAARAAFGRYGFGLPAFYVVTREGWFDLVNDRTALWGQRSA